MIPTIYTESEVKRIERMAMKILKGGAKSVSPPKKPKMSEEAKKKFAEEKRLAKRLSGRIRKYQEMTGKKGVTKKEKDLLTMFTPTQVIQAKLISPKKLENRIKAYEKRYGTATPQEKYWLRYATPRGLGKLLNKGDVRIGGRGDVPEGGGAGRTGWAILRTVNVNIPWSIMPVWVKMLSRGKGSFLYENSFIFTEGMIFPENVRMMVSGNDVSLDDVVMHVLDEKVFAGASELIHNPEKRMEKGDLVYRSDWKNVGLFHPNFKQNHLYKPIDWKYVKVEDIVDG